LAPKSKNKNEAYRNKDKTRFVCVGNLQIWLSLDSRFQHRQAEGIVGSRSEGQTVSMSKPLTFDDAFKILDQAMNDQQPAMLSSLVADEIQFFKTSIRNEANESLQDLARGRDEVGGLVKEFTALGLGHAREVAESVETHVRENPLLYIGVATAGVLALGFLLSRPRTKKSSVTDIGVKNDEVM
jgi:ElaB/YqjD/DUF883 family membrane-anchored ribosome-binding protein